jgi:hypothetical protein
VDPATSGASRSRDATSSEQASRSRDATQSKRATRLRWLAALSVVMAALVYLASDVDTALTDADERAIARLDLDEACARTESYEGELACVRALQATMLAAAPEVECVHVWGEVSHEPDAFLARRKGCCYDRSRLVEKALAFYGFEVRHLSLHRLRLPPPFGYLQSVPSHSTSEVRTRRGFMVVDSNRPYYAVDRDGDPLDAVALRAALRDPARRAGLGEVPGDYFDGDYTVFYGLYSRHGGFYPPFAPVPDIDWAQVWANF